MAARFYVSGMGEYYSDCLKVEAFVKDRTVAQEGGSLLCSKLQEREAARDKMVTYLARKRGISVQQMWDDIIADRAKPMSAEEFKELQDLPEDE